MNQLLQKTSFVSGIILLFAPIVFSLVLKMASGFQSFLYTFNQGQTLLYVVFLIVSVLEVVFFIKLFRAYRFREPHAYYLIYFLGILVALGIMGVLLWETYQYVQITKTIFFFVLLFTIFSFRYQKENFIIADNSLGIRNNVLLFLTLAALVGIVSYYISVYFISERFVFPYILSALISLALIPWWRKKVTSRELSSFLFLPGFYIIVTQLVLQLFVFLYLISNDSTPWRQFVLI